MAGRSGSRHERARAQFLSLHFQAAALRKKHHREEIEAAIL
jgi:hypothetical protein